MKEVRIHFRQEFQKVAGKKPFLSKNKIRGKGNFEEVIAVVLIDGIENSLNFFFEGAGRANDFQKLGAMGVFIRELIFTAHVKLLKQGVQNHGGLVVKVPVRG